MRDSGPFNAAVLAAMLAIAAPASGAEAVGGHDDAPVYIVTAHATWQGVDDLFREAAPRVDRAGNALVLIQTRRDQIDVLARHVHAAERRCGGFFAFASRSEAEAFLASDHARRASTYAPRGGYTIDNANTVNPWLAQVSAANIQATISQLSAFHTRHYASATGSQAAVWIRDAWLALAEGRDDVDAELFTACNDCGTQASVILTIQGSLSPEEVVVLGGHLDSINWDASGNSAARAPGADDDASGIATLTEILRIALDSGFRPQRTVKFMAYAAEEVGLNGSQAIANSFQASGAEVVGVLQLDMTNYHEPGQADIEIISDFTNAGLNTFIGALFDAYLQPLGLTRGSSPCGYGCSDHAAWTAAGYPSAFAFEGGGINHSFGEIHSAFDLIENMGGNAARSVPFAQLGLAFLGEVAKGSTPTGDSIFVHGFETAPGRR